MNDTRNTCPIRPVEPDSRCPVCTSRPTHVVRSAHGLVQHADYVCAAGHIWQTRWVVG